MAEFEVDLDEGESRDRCALLAQKVREFIGRLTGSPKINPIFIHAERLSREWLRDRMIRMVATVFYSKPTETAPLTQIQDEVKQKYSGAVDKFVEEQLDLIAEIRLSV